MIIDLKKVGEVLIPTMFQSVVEESNKFSLVDNRLMESFDKLQKELRKDNALVIKSGSDRKKIDKLYQYLIKKGSEILDRDLLDQLSSREGSSSRRKGYDYYISKKLAKLFLLCDSDEILSFKDRETIPFLYSFGGSDLYEDGEERYDKNTSKYLIPYKFYLELKDHLNNPVYVKSIDKNISSGVNILLPKSQETTEIFIKGFEEITEKPENILEMGCGSGVLSIALHQNFPSAQIFLTDILPEALATARYNISNSFEGSFVYNRAEKVDIYNSFNFNRSGNLYEKIYRKFDLIIFNAPWIVTKARNRSELALNDEDQQTVKSFLLDSYNHLNSRGEILLGYSNNSGDEAVDALEILIEDSNYEIVKRHSVRVQSYQSGRKWMKIYLYHLRRGD